MTSLFKTTLAARLANDNDKTHAERLEVKFMKNGSKDPSRLNTEIQATLQHDATILSSLGGGNSNDWQGEMSGDTSVVFVSKAQYPNLTFRSGDRFRAIEDPASPFYDIENIGSSAGRWIFEVRKSK